MITIRYWPSLLYVFCVFQLLIFVGDIFDDFGVQSADTEASVRFMIFIHQVIWSASDYTIRISWLFELECVIFAREISFWGNCFPCLSQSHITGLQRLNPLILDSEVLLMCLHET
jgi:hypothetical protein